MKRKAKSVRSLFDKRWHAFKTWFSVTSNVAPWAIACLLGGILYAKSYRPRHYAAPRTVSSAGMASLPQGKFKAAPHKAQKGNRPSGRKRR